MTQKEFFIEVEDNLNEGYGVKMVSPNNFRMSVTFSHRDNTGELYYVAIGIDGSEFDSGSKIFTIDELDKFVNNSHFEVYEVFDNL